jgi:hypothetical protein
MNLLLTLKRYQQRIARFGDGGMGVPARQEDTRSLNSPYYPNESFRLEYAA